jgi:hypothetical protein
MVLLITLVGRQVFFAMHYRTGEPGPAGASAKERTAVLANRNFEVPFDIICGIFYY